MNETSQTYVSPEGAAAYFEKEQKTAQSRNQAAWAMLDRIPVNGRTALDIGCGFGRDVAAMRSRQATAYGIDISPTLIEKARSAYGEGFMVEDFLTRDSLPFGLQSVHVVWAYAVLVHVPRSLMPQLIKRWVGWLAPGGHLALMVKHGTGEQMVHNLGPALPRQMVFYQAYEFLDSLPAFKVVHQAVRNVREPAEDYLELILEKPV